LNAQVPPSYARRDPEQHLRGLATSLGLRGRGVGTLTAADVGLATYAEDRGVQVCSTVGVDCVVFAAEDGDSGAGRGAVGTINVFVLVPRPMAPSALVNSVATATEAKTQALLDAGFSGTGTPTDAICILCPDGDEEVRFGGPRSPWGSRVADAVHSSVLAGARRQQPS